MVAKITYADQRSVVDTGAAVDVAALEAAVDAVAGPVAWTSTASARAASSGRSCTAACTGSGVASCMWADPHAALTSAAGLAPRRRGRHLPHGHDDRRDRLAAGRARPGRHDDRDHELRPGTDPRGQSDVVLTTATRETTFRTGAMSSRVSQLVLVDFLFTGRGDALVRPSVSALESARAGPPGAAHRAADRPTARHDPRLGRPGLAVQA